MKPIVLDTETTGFSHETDRVIEFAASEFNLDTGVLCGAQLQTYINPECSISEEASGVNGLTEDFLKDKPKFAEVAEQIAAMCRGRHIIIHNSSFDVRFLNAEFKRLKLEPLDKIAAKITCSRNLSRRLMPQRNASLSPLCEFFGIDISGRTTHGALIDCSLLGEVYVRLARMEAEALAKIQSIVPFPIGGELSDNQAVLCNQYQSLSWIIGYLEAESKRIKAAAVKLCHGVPYQDRDNVIEFGEPGVATDWAKVVKDLLPNADLKPYQKAKAASTSIKSA